jgi:HSP20 family protein
MLVRRVWPSRPTFESPFDDFDQLRHHLQRLFDAVGESALGRMGAGVFPPINVTQDNSSIYVRAEIPGIDPKDLDVTAQGRRLSISGKRAIPKESNRASYHRQERAEGEFSRTVTLPTEVETASADARYNAGILSVSLPKAEIAKARQIQVKA